MKAILFAALVATAASMTTANSCVIPGDYTANAVTAACTGPAAGYNVGATCLNVDGTPFSTVALATGQTAFNGAAGVLGCLIAGQDAAFAAPTACPALAAGMPLSAGAIKAITVTCATGFWALPGTFGGTLPCVSSTAGTTYINALPAGATAGAFSNVYGTPNPLVLTGANRLQCVGGCTLPAPICNAGVVNSGAFLVDPATGLRVTPTATCQFPPGTSVQAFPANNLGLTAPATYTCSTTGALTTTGTNWIPLTGAVACPWIGTQLTGTPRTFPAGTLGDYNTVTSTVTSSAIQTIPQGQAIQQYAAVTGCPIGVAGNACVQDAIRYWRCRGFQIDSCTVCLNNGVRIACPTSANGYGDCDDGSKKGLLGLLGLLGIIPLCLCCLLLCCLLFPCCIRRKKTEGDVHFATFDPHAAPVAASVVPTATAYCASPAMATACF